MANLMLNSVFEVGVAQICINTNYLVCMTFTSNAKAVNTPFAQQLHTVVNERKKYAFVTALQ